MSLNEDMAWSTARDRPRVVYSSADREPGGGRRGSPIMKRRGIQKGRSYRLGLFVFLEQISLDAAAAAGSAKPATTTRTRRCRRPRHAGHGAGDARHE